MIYGVIGKIGSGKTTLSNYLIEHHGFKRKAFADNLKEACRIIFGFTDEQLYGTQEQKETPDPRWYGVSPRQVFQFFGTECVRMKMNELMPGIGEDIWIKSFELSLNPDENIVVDDVRFNNEAEMIKKLGGKIVKIIKETSSKNDDVKNHISETEQDGIIADYYIVNDSTIDAYHQKIKTMVENK